MFHHNFDPYDALIELNARLEALEKVHNKLADAFVKTQHDLNVTMESLVGLQRAHLQAQATLRAHGIR